jgi:surface antigen
MRGRGARRVVSCVLGSVLLAGLLTACQPGQVGGRCSTKDFGDDGVDLVLVCRNGRWQPLMTKQQVAQIILASRSAPDALVAGSNAVNDDYPANLRNASMNSVTDPWGFPNRQCTSFVAWRLAQTNHYTLPVPVGDARNWDDRLAPDAVVDSTPAVGAIAVWDANESYGGLGAGPLGHVAWVQAVYADGSVSIEQYNLGSNGTYVQMHHTRAPRYVHVRDL